MKRVVFMIIPALICGVVFTSCGGDTIGTKIGKEVCECISKEKASGGERVPGLGNALVPLGCYVTTAEKYKEYFEVVEDEYKFKDPKHQKDFEAAITKLCPDYK